MHGGIYYHHEVIAYGNGEGVRRCADRGPSADNTTVAQVVRVVVGRIVDLRVTVAFDVTWPTECRVDRHGVATRPAARVSEGKRFVSVRSGETTAGAALRGGAGARAAIPANTIGLRRSTRRELAGWNLLIRTAGTGRDGERDRLASARVSQVK